LLCGELGGGGACQFEWRLAVCVWDIGVVAHAAPVLVLRLLERGGVGD